MLKLYLPHHTHLVQLHQHLRHYSSHFPQYFKICKNFLFFVFFLFLAASAAPLADKDLPTASDNAGLFLRSTYADKRQDNLFINQKYGHTDNSEG